MSRVLASEKKNKLYQIDANNLRVAIVHDYLNAYGGAERVVDALSELFPQAPMYTLLYDKNKFQNLQNNIIHPSFIQSFPSYLRSRYKLLLPILPTAIETFDLSEFDIVISSSASFAKGIIVKPETLHINYCHSPMRYAWDWYHNYILEQGLGFIKRPLAMGAMNVLRMWDRKAADRVDYFVANSKTTAKRIKTYYRRDSKVIYPPVDVSSFPANNKSKGYFLLVSRLSPYKRADIVVRAFNKLQLPLLIIGEGSEFEYLQSIAHSNVKLLGFQSDEKVRRYFSFAEAFIFPAEDDFGITAVEAMACGKPVLALRKGGVTETVKEGVTGEFFDEPYEELVADGVRRIRENYNLYNAQVIRTHAEQFSRSRFLDEFLTYLQSFLKNKDITHFSSEDQ